MSQYELKTETHIIKISKLDTDEYEFVTIYEHIEYYGKSFLKSLSFIEDLQEYLTNEVDNINIDVFDDYIMIKLPIMYSSKVEIVQLNKTNLYEEGFHRVKKENKKLKQKISELAVHKIHIYQKVSCNRVSNNFTEAKTDITLDELENIMYEMNGMRELYHNFKPGVNERGYEAINSVQKKYNIQILKIFISVIYIEYPISGDFLFKHDYYKRTNLEILIEYKNGYLYDYDFCSWFNNSSCSCDVYANYDMLGIITSLSSGSNKNYNYSMIKGSKRK